MCVRRLCTRGSASERNCTSRLVRASSLAGLWLRSGAGGRSGWTNFTSCVYINESVALPAPPTRVRSRELSESWRGVYRMGNKPIKRHLRRPQTTEPRSQNVIFIGCQSVRQFELPFAADCCPCVEKLLTV
jgi:hypothetical protein